MKKLLALMLALCLVFAVLVGAVSRAPAGLENPFAPETPAEDTPAPSVALEIPAETEEAAPSGLDYGAIYALHAPEETVLTLGGTQASWALYFYMLYSQAENVADFFESMSSYYGTELSWADEYAEGVSYAEMTMRSTEETLTMLCAIRDFAQANQVSLPEEVRSQMEADIQSDMVTLCGEGATEEAFAAYLAERYMTPELYRWINETNLLYRQGYIQLYGETGELYDEDLAMDWLENGGYLSAGHILLMSVDPATGEALDEEAKAQKRDQAQAIAEELQAIQDPEELLARFKELKEEFCEDTGKTSYPDGYTFTPGTMVAEFEDMVNALGDYQVSDPVESSYGYHVIMRLPLSADAVIQYSSDGQTPMTARSMASNEEYAAQLQAYYDSHPFTYAEGFAPVDLLDYVQG